MPLYFCTELLATWLHTAASVYRTWLRRTFLTCRPGPELTTRLVTQTARGTTVGHPRQGLKRCGYRRNVGEMSALPPSDRWTCSTPAILSMSVTGPQRNHAREVQGVPPPTCTYAKIPVFLRVKPQLCDRPLSHPGGGGEVSPQRHKAPAEPRSRTVGKEHADQLLRAPRRCHAALRLPGRHEPASPAGRRNKAAPHRLSAVFES